MVEVELEVALKEPPGKLHPTYYNVCPVIGAHEVGLATH